MRCRCLCAKLSKVSSRNVDTLSSEVYKTFSTLDMESISLVKQCHFLELSYASNFTNEILSNSVDSIRSLKKRVIEADRALLLEQSKNHQSQKLIARVAESEGWMKFWDAGLDKALSPSFPTSSCCVKLFSLTEPAPWNYVTSSFLRTVLPVITFLLNTQT